MINKEILAEKTQTLLEYPQIMEKVASYALSEEASVIIKGAKPVYDRHKALETKKIVRTIYTRIKTTNNEPRSWLPSIGFLIPKIETIGTVLDLDEAFAIGLFIERAAELVNWLKKKDTPDRRQFSVTENFVKNLPDCKPVADEIFRIIDRDGNLRDLPVLRAIRRRINNLEKELNSAVSKYSSNEEYKRMLQSSLPSQRDGRIVIAVKANYRGRIHGIVHEVSSSGQTVFMEPFDVVEKNNAILLEKRNLDTEIHKLLRELTEKITSYSENLKLFYPVIIELECLRARAKYSVITKGHFTLETTQQEAAKENNSLFLKQARHPMLKKAVPINIEMNSNIRTLIITGPNTGGKTVALKTLGLFAMMNQSALALPLEEGSMLPFFDGIYADIGDEQSIDQSLSTFSAHITNISAITANASENSLVLLDELGSGTDPEEGCAIAMAILDYLIEKNARMIITTHHGILKNYGYTRQGVENACMEFDIKSLCPTYKIINGIPGESRALDIAATNGLDSRIIKKARDYITEEKSDISALIKGLEKKQRELAVLEQKNVTEQNKLKEEKRKSDLKELQLRQKEAELKRESVGKLHVFLHESRKTLENLVRELREGEVTREKTLKVKEFLNELAHNAEIESAALDEEERITSEQFQNNNTENAISAKESLYPGVEVFAGRVSDGSLLKQRGIIVRSDKKYAAGKSWIVKIGALKMSFPESELLPVTQSLQQKPFSHEEPLSHGKPLSSNSNSWIAEYSSSSSRAVFELKLLGLRLDDATEALRRQIEAAVVSGFKTFSVIHGKGNGILQKGIHDYLKEDPAVAEFCFARPELGGSGRTEVVLK